MLHSDGKAEKLLWILAVLPTVVQCRVAVASPDSITTVLAGGSVHFPILHVSEDKYEVTLWKTSPNQLNILAWMSDRPESPYVIHPSYRNRVHFRSDGVIEMRGINMSDQGTYEVQTNYFGRELRNRDREQFEIHVVEPVSEPTVEISRNASHVTLNCSALGTGQVTYRWERQTDAAGGNVTFHGALLFLQNDGLSGHTYNCIAENCCSRQISLPVSADLNPASESRNYWASVLSFIVLSVVVMLILGQHLLRKSVLIGQAHPETKGQESSSEDDGSDCPLRKSRGSSDPV
ncbi:uncharacterized protein LOC132385431 [Hypanus sabinus]|uniref:uncharacterized protein LOC132385431 n=1 Tax=Hypanus sabinus TaxID=79690 RepID=UPI0028C41FFE|nr:uncharacterized protein LOC132385431 [Hypanus sabinus]XP_059813482.1 uncharacterized protein LOC132385431 [Hypanus sabinus]